MIPESTAPERFERNVSNASPSLTHVDRMDLLVPYPFEQSNASQSYLPTLDLFDGAQQAKSSANTSQDSPMKAACEQLDVPKDHGPIKSVQHNPDDTITNYSDGSSKMEFPAGNVSAWDAVANSTTQINTDGTTSVNFLRDGSTLECNKQDGTSEIKYDLPGSKNTIVGKQDGTIEHTVETPVTDQTTDPAVQLHWTRTSIFTEKRDGDLAIKESTQIDDQKMDSDEVVLHRKDLSDGTKMYTTEDNSIQVSVSPDKTITETMKFEDSDYRSVVHPDGSYEQSSSDGTKSRRLADGTFELERPDDKQITFARVNPDGSVFTHGYDGSDELIKPDGRAVVFTDGVEEHRRVTITLDDGRKLYPEYIDGQPSLQMPNGTPAQLKEAKPGDDQDLNVVDANGKVYKAKIDKWSSSAGDELAFAEQSLKQDPITVQALSLLSNSK
jgi:hypothetical protein